jgi:exodeoxyribonuclease V beta subunit
VRSGAGKSEKTDLHRTAIGYLLQKGRRGMPGHWRPPSPTWPRPCRVAVGEPSLTRPAPLPAEAETPGEPSVRAFRQLERDWWISSYSGLAARATATAGVLAPASTTRWHRGCVTVQEEEAPAFHLHLPQGARPGTLLHSLFETIDFEHAGVSHWHSTSPPC